MIQRVINLLFRCHHKRLTRPITPVYKTGEPHSAYVACLDCGKRFHYDVANMSVGMPIPFPAVRERSRAAS